MNLLLLGYSSVVRRRVLPAARSVPAIGRIAVASRRDGVRGEGDEIAWFNDYDEALRSSGADLVYVSGVNTEHTAWVERALERGLHVMVDKPAFPDPRTAQACVELARTHRLGLAEATVFAFHPQVAALDTLIDPAEAGSTRVSATLSFPPLPPGDFRYRADCGGGSLYDVGPYLTAINRLVFGRAPDRVECAVLTRGGGPEVDTSFSALLTHAGGGSLTGHFGFVTAYQNRLSVLTRSRAIDAERLFTTPPDMACALRVREDRDERIVPVPPADSFACFLQAFIEAIGETRFGAFESALLEDAALLARLREAAGVLS